MPRPRREVNRHTCAAALATRGEVTSLSTVCRMEPRPRWWVRVLESSLTSAVLAGVVAFVVGSYTASRADDSSTRIWDATVRQPAYEAFMNATSSYKIAVDGWHKCQNDGELLKLSRSVIDKRCRLKPVQDAEPPMIATKAQVDLYGSAKVKDAAENYYMAVCWNQDRANATCEKKRPERLPSDHDENALAERWCLEARGEYADAMSADIISARN